jgi:hypothetical protein
MGKQTAFISIFFVDGIYHSTQDNEMAYRWAVEGSTYPINGKLKKAVIVIEKIKTEKVSIKLIELQ